MVSLCNSSRPDFQVLARAVHALRFFGVPHAGMNIGALMAAAEGRWNAEFIASLGSESPVLDTLRNDFDRLDMASKSFCYYETKVSPTLKQVCSYSLLCCR